MVKNVGQKMTTAMFVKPRSDVCRISEFRLRRLNLRFLHELREFMHFVPGMVLFDCECDDLKAVFTVVILLLNTIAAKQRHGLVHPVGTGEIRAAARRDLIVEGALFLEGKAPRIPVER